ncbi:hypothetical protein [Gluconobacter sp. GP1]|uniref:hypothetical protein n=1 Tax=Gluconobacter sp. GP1 TaxID=3046423 RepID=UPI00293EDC80|nr:hypothetical protein [Gluconobacter sp. GP1]
MTLNQNKWRDMLPVGLLVFALIIIVFSKRSGSVYGLPSNIPAADIVQLVSAVAPVLFFICSIIREVIIADNSPIYSKRIKDALYITSLSNFVTIITIFVNGCFFDANFFYAAVGWESDFLLIYWFVFLIGIISPRPRYIALIAVSYSILAVVIGIYFNIVPFVGFDTTPMITISRFSTLPLQGWVPWLWRLYWALILITLSLAFWHRSRRAEQLDCTLHDHGSRLRVIAIISTFSTVAALAMMFLRDEQQLSEKYPKVLGEIPAPFNQLTVRPRVTQFVIAVDGRDPSNLILQGNIRLTNTSPEPITNVLFEHAQMMVITSVETSLRAQILQSTDRRLIGVHLTAALRPGEQLIVDYRGRISPRNILDTVVRSRLLSRGIFLQTPTLLPLPRVSACARPKKSEQPCATDENYLLGDAARGTVSILTLPKWTVAEAAKVAESPTGWLFRLDATGREWSNLLIAAARYEKHDKILTPCGSIEVDFVSSNVKAADDVAKEVCDAQTHYRQTFGDVGAFNNFSIIEVPNSITEATAFPRAIALSERVLNSVHSDQISPLLRFILWHETAHLWWGYGIIPRQDKGLGFALESVPQFLALKNATTFDNGTKIRKTLLAQQEHASRRQGSVLRPVWEAPLDWQAYIRGPLTLDELDRSGKVESCLARAYHTLAERKQYYSGYDLAKALTISDDAICTVGSNKVTTR